MKKHVGTLIILFFVFTNIMNSQSKKLIERQFQLEETKNQITKLSTEIEKLENLLKIINQIKSNYEINKNVKKSNLTEVIEKIKNTPVKKEFEIISLIEQLRSIYFENIYNIREIISEYEDKTEYIEITNLYNRIRNINTNESFLRNLINYSDLTNNKTLNTPYFQDFKNTLEETSILNKLQDIKDQYGNIIYDVYNTMSTTISDKNQELADLRKKKIELEIEKRNESEYDKTIFQWGFPVFIFFILLLYLLPLWFLHKRHNSDTSSILNLYKSIYSSGLLTEIVTVFLLTSTILLLGITNKLNAEILGTLIGAISGYVLGRSFNNNKNREQ